MLFFFFFLVLPYATLPMDLVLIKKELAFFLTFHCSGASFQIFDKVLSFFHWECFLEEIGISTNLIFF